MLTVTVITTSGRRNINGTAKSIEMDVLILIPGLSTLLILVYNMVITLQVHIHAVCIWK